MINNVNNLNTTNNNNNNNSSSSYSNDKLYKPSTSRYLLKITL